MYNIVIISDIIYIHVINIYIYVYMCHIYESMNVDGTYIYIYHNPVLHATCAMHMVLHVHACCAHVDTVCIHACMHTIYITHMCA